MMDIVFREQGYKYTSDEILYYMRKHSRSAGPMLGL